MSGTDSSIIYLAMCVCVCMCLCYRRPHLQSFGAEIWHRAGMPPREGLAKVWAGQTPPPGRGRPKSASGGPHPGVPQPVQVQGDGLLPWSLGRWGQNLAGVLPPPPGRTAAGNACEPRRVNNPNSINLLLQLTYFIWKSAPRCLPANPNRLILE